MNNGFKCLKVTPLLAKLKPIQGKSKERQPQALLVKAILSQFPGCVLVTGSSEWDAPRIVSPVKLSHFLNIPPKAYFHLPSPSSALSISPAVNIVPNGIILSKHDYSIFKKAIQELKNNALFTQKTISSEIKSAENKSKSSFYRLVLWTSCNKKSNLVKIKKDKKITMYQLPKTKNNKKIKFQEIPFV